jgi:hypothetical protein
MLQIVHHGVHIKSIFVDMNIHQLFLIRQAIKTTLLIRLLRGKYIIVNSADEVPCSKEDIEIGPFRSLTVGSRWGFDHFEMSAPEANDLLERVR